MKLEKARDQYYFFSGKTSDLVRQLGLGGIAIVWLFKQTVDGAPKIPDELVWPLTCIVIALAIDFMQYAVATVLWGNLQWRKDRSGVKDDQDFVVHPAINWPTIFFFSVKTIAVMIAYWHLLIYLPRTLFL
ncbi:MULTISPECIES: hypothetical protein [unclassified Janthinobacterium]|uniref:hypothetical protein n=1 Tax=unclassified Janthinobacterium TaxID=2610881 RepID=UPI0011130CAD|nr:MULTISPECIES: hypothetical protein [unclassified Janthinobacterium]